MCMSTRFSSQTTLALVENLAPVLKSIVRYYIVSFCYVSIECLSRETRGGYLTHLFLLGKIRGTLR